MKAITVATHSERYFPLLIESAEKNGYELEVLGWGMKWEGFAMKIVLIREYLNNVNPDEIVLYVDAFDSVFLSPSSELEEKFLSCNADIVWNAEDLGLYPLLPRYLSKRFFQSSLDLVIVSDMFVGRARALLAAFDVMCEKQDSKKLTRQDDQRIINSYFFSGNRNMTRTDTEKNLFFSLIEMRGCGNPIRRYSPEKAGGRIKVRVNGKPALPCVVSGPAGADIGRLVGVSSPSLKIEPLSMIGRIVYYSKFIATEYTLIVSTVIFFCLSLINLPQCLFFCGASFAALLFFMIYQILKKRK